MWKRVLIKSLLYRRSRIAVLMAALLLSSALVSAFLVLGGNVEHKAAGELNAYGPNLMVLPKGFDLALALGGLEMGSIARSEELPPDSIAGLKPLNEIEAYAPFQYGTAAIGQQQAVIAGTSLPSLNSLFPGWSWQGEPTDPQAVYPGIELARRLGVKMGDSIVLTARDIEFPLKVGGVVQVGGSEDRQLLMDIELSSRILGQDGADLVLLRAQGSGRQLETTARVIESIVPGSQTRVLSQVSETESKVLSRIRSIMGLVMALALSAAALAVFSTMTLLIWERRREVGLMKALGASETRIAFQFFAEAWALMIVAALPGSLLGLAIARWIALRVFSSPIDLPPYALPLTWLILFWVTTAAAYLPVRRTARIQPAMVLKGE